MLCAHIYMYTRTHLSCSLFSCIDVCIGKLQFANQQSVQSLEDICIYDMHFSSSYAICNHQASTNYYGCVLVSGTLIIKFGAIEKTIKCSWYPFQIKSTTLAFKHIGCSMLFILGFLYCFLYGCYMVFYISISCLCVF